jgi:hypothetical protein
MISSYWKGDREKTVGKSGHIHNSRPAKSGKSSKIISKLKIVVNSDHY